MSVTQNLTNVISNVLENMFFTFVRPVSCAECAQSLVGVFFHKVQVSLADRDHRLDVAIFFASDLAEQMTASFLGEERGQVSLSQISDVLKEAVNMIGGGLINICDPEGIMVLGIPETFGVGEATISDGMVCYDTDGSYLLVGWTET
ncbi:MAG: hypothetical protein JXO49_10525 [Deltaproteobacteria bacterium]|nr:hypothetical protein [Candidatus Anaeroferrophillus wilburensis]MBN2889766.1 hypothetical protein [Deltaproteobacteria bacterium]